MQQQSKTFDISLNNIPHINLRNEFVRYYSALNDEDFISQFKGEIQPIKTPYMTWYGMPDDLLTLIVQKVTVGLESYLPGAVFMELGKQGRLKENVLYVRDPFKLKGRGTVENYYHLLPSLINDNVSLKNSDLKLYNETKAFYKEIRNPIFHGSELQDQNIIGIKNIFEYLANVYKWIDSWCEYDI
jgi:hypothetical protein